jgi:hypothetical protein
MHVEIEAEAALFPEKKYIYGMGFSLQCSGHIHSPWLGEKVDSGIGLKVHKREKFFVSDFEFFTIL